MHTLAGTKVPLEDVLDDPFLVERLYDAEDWTARFERLDEMLAARLAEVRPPEPGVTWAWRRLIETGGRTAIGDLAGELSWSRKRIAARFQEEVGVSPKTAARDPSFRAGAAERRALPGARLGADRASSAGTTTNLT